MAGTRSDLVVELFRLGDDLRSVARELSIHTDEEGSSPENRSAFSFGTGQLPDDGLESLSTRRTRLPLPDPRLVRQTIRKRELRSRFFDADLFADPAWDMLLDLAAARAEHQRVSVTSLCIASGVPSTTALRWISQMVDTGLLERTECDVDRRRAFITLSNKAADAMARYFATLQTHVFAD